MAWLGALAPRRSRPSGPLPFVLAGGAGLALSTLHLGRKDRAWRAALNGRCSWLSREVLAVPLFLALSAAFLLAPAQGSAGALATAAGLVALACVDRVYVVMARERRSRGDDTAALLSAAFLAGVLADAAVARPSRRPWRVSPRSRSG